MAGVTKVWTGAAEYCCGGIACDPVGMDAVAIWISWLV